MLHCLWTTWPNCGKPEIGGQAAMRPHFCLKPCRTQMIIKLTHSLCHLPLIISSAQLSFLKNRSTSRRKSNLLPRPILFRPTCESHFTMSIYNPNNLEMSCVFVAVARLLGTTAEDVSETTGWLPGGGLWIGEVCQLLQSTGTTFAWFADGSVPQVGVSQYGLLYTSKTTGCAHAVNMELHSGYNGQYWLMADYSWPGGMRYYDADSEIGTIHMAFWISGS